VQGGSNQGQRLADGVCVAFGFEVNAEVDVPCRQACPEVDVGRAWLLLEGNHHLVEVLLNALPGQVCLTENLDVL
jgi:hypothetical protein